MEIPFKVSVGFVVLWQHLDMEIPFKVSVGFVVLWHHLDIEIPFKVSWALSFCCNILTWKFPSRFLALCRSHLDIEVPFKVSVGPVVLLQHLDIQVLFKVRGICRWQHLDMEIPSRCPALSFCCNILTWKFPSRFAWAL